MNVISDVQIERRADVVFAILFRSTMPAVAGLQGRDTLPWRQAADRWTVITGPLTATIVLTGTYQRHQQTLWPEVWRTM
jgi:hypothetical protein